MLITSESVPKTAGGNWDPFENCGNQPQYDVTSHAKAIHLMYWQAIIGAIISLSYAYAAVKNAGSNYNDSFAAIQDGLHEIQHKLDEIDNKLNSILIFLSQLPEQIQGAIDEGNFKQTLGEARGWARQTKDFSRQDKVHQHEKELSDSLQNLDALLASLKGIKGLAAVMLAAPLIGAWLVGSIALEKSRAKTDPQYTPYSPWEKSLMTETEQDIHTFYDEAFNLNIHFEKVVIPAFPKHAAMLQIASGLNGEKVLEKRPPIPGFPGGGDLITRFGDLKITCPYDDIYGERLMVYVRDNSGIIPDPVAGKWVADRSSDGALAFQSYLKQREEMSTFFVAYTDLLSKQQEIYEPFIEPPGIWS
jgi:Skp family chaperone for outer membrane proteins